MTGLQRGATAEQAVRDYTVVGAGAIGGTLALHLAQAGHAVTVVDADEDHVAAIREHGVRLLLTGGGVRTARVNAVTPAHLTGPLGRVLLAVKAQATERAVAGIGDHLAPEGFIVSMQNGLNEELIAARVGAKRTVGACVDFFADVVGPGVIQAGGGGALAIGETDGSRSRRVQELVADLRAAGLPAVATGNVQGYLWSKLAFGAMLVATALADAPMADLIDRHRSLMQRLAGEVLTVADSLGIVPESVDAFEPRAYGARSSVEARTRATDALVAWLRTQGKTRSGIWRDIVIRHRPTEVPVHYAPVLSHAAAAHLAVPYLEMLLARVAAVEAGDQLLGERHLNEFSERIQAGV